jgi:uncharacterized protein (TIGR02453 family)
MHAVTTRGGRFTGFNREGLELLRQLDANNTRAWFTARRRLFNELLVEPALELVVEMGPLLRQRVSPAIRAEPRVGGSILRMQHDARFQRERPFRTHLELWFWEGRGPSHAHPGFFLRVSPEALVVGAGITLFPPDLLPEYRDRVDDPGPGRELAAILHRLGRAGYEASGARLRRTPRPYPPDHERAALLRQLGLRAERTEALPRRAPEELVGPMLPDLLLSCFSRLKPLHRWLQRLG